MKFKKLLFSVVTVVFSGLAWYFFSQIFQGSNIFSGNGANWTMFIILLGLSYSFAFLVALTKDRFDFIITSLLSVLWILVFMGINLKTLISAAALFVATQVLMEFSKALARSLSVKYFVTAYSKIALVILVVLGISSAYLQDKVAVGISQQTFSQQTSDFAWPFISKYLTQFNSDETVNNYISDQYQAQGINHPSDAMIGQEREAISTQIGIDLKGNEKMSDIGKKFVASKFNSILKQYNLDKAGLFVIFFSLLILWPIGRFVFAALAAIVAWIMRKTKVLHVVDAAITTKNLEL
jgi:hypothetical protein